MSDLLDTLLDQLSNSSERAAISAGWELGSGLAPQRHGELNVHVRKEIERASEQISRKTKLNADLVHGAALMAMTLTER